MCPFVILGIVLAMTPMFFTVLLTQCNIVRCQLHGRGCKRTCTAKSFDLSKSRAKSMKMFAKYPKIRAKNGTKRLNLKNWHPTCGESYEEVVPKDGFLDLCGRKDS